MIKLSLYINKNKEIITNNSYYNRTKRITITTGGDC